jgi:hypothetical protein
MAPGEHFRVLNFHVINPLSHEDAGEWYCERRRLEWAQEEAECSGIPFQEGHTYSVTVVRSFAPHSNN